MNKLNPYIIDGIEIERVHPSGPYALVVFFKHGAIKIISNGHDPQKVRSTEEKVARNSAVIQRIELQDNGETLETIWDADWNECSLCHQRDRKHYLACEETWSHAN